MHLHFYLEKRISNRGNISHGCPLILSVAYSSNRIKVYTGKKVPEAEWDKKPERMRPQYSGSAELNAYLDLLSKRVLEYYNEYMNPGAAPVPAAFRIEIRKMIHSEVPQFFPLLLRFMEENNGKWSNSTFKKIKSFYNQLKEFSIVRQVIIEPQKVNRELAEMIIDYYRSKGLRDTSIKKNLDLLRWFMNWALHEGLIFNRDFEMISFSPEKNKLERKENFLGWNELIKFYSFAGLSKKEEWCRDVFCFIAFSGIRFSRVSKLRKENLSGWRITCIHGNNDGIMLNRFAFEICRKYENKYYRNNSLFPSLSLITFHKYIRLVAEKANLTRLINSEGSGKAMLPLSNKISAQLAMNTYYAHAVKLGYSGGLNNLFASGSAKSRIALLAGSLNIAEENLKTTSDRLYESSISI